MPKSIAAAAMVPIVVVSMILMVACSNEPKQVEAVTLQKQIDRGRYLVDVSGCHHCHSPKVFTSEGPVIDSARMLSGHPAGTPLPQVPTGAIGPGNWGALTTNDLTAWVGPWGISFASNLTPDEVTGIGAWPESSFILAMRNGRHLGTGRPILPPMPWQDIGKLTDEDMKAMFAYLRSIKPVNNMVPLPVPVNRVSVSSM